MEASSAKKILSLRRCRCVSSRISAGERFNNLAELKHFAYDVSANKVKGADLHSAKEMLVKCGSEGLVDTVYFLTKVSRKAGHITDPRLTVSLFGRLWRSLDYFDRQDLIKTLQVCSLSINRNKIESGCDVSSELGLKRDEIVGTIIQRLSSRTEDLPTNSISVALSSLARMYNPSMKALMDEMSLVIARRISKLLGRPVDSASAYMQRSDLHRAIPFILLGYHQNMLTAPSDLVDASIPLYTKYTSEVPYKHLSQYMLMTKAENRIDPLRSYALDRIQAAPEDMTVMDVCRFAQAISPDSMQIIFDTIARKNNPRDWDIHSLVELSRILREGSKKLWNKYMKKLIDLKYSIPPNYLLEIFHNSCRCNDKAAVHVAQTVLEILSSRQLRSPKVIESICLAATEPVKNLSAYKEFIKQ
jgi:hypothetical protein